MIRFGPILYIVVAGLWSVAAPNEVAAQEVHVVTVYEGDYLGKLRRRGEHPEGQVNVRIRVTGKPVVLVLSAYEPVKWVLSLDSGVRLQRVIASGYYKQIVVGAGSARITTEDLISLQRETLVFPPYADSASDVSAMAASIKKVTGSAPVTFQREYQGKEFVVDGRKGK